MRRYPGCSGRSTRTPWCWQPADVLRVDRGPDRTPQDIPGGPGPVHGRPAPGQPGPGPGLRDDPLIDPRFFRSAPFSGATASALAPLAPIGGFLFLNTLYLHGAPGSSPPAG